MTIADAVAFPSVIVYWIVAGPLKNAAELNVSVPSGLIATVPCAAGTVAAITVSGSPSGSLSLARTLMMRGVPSVALVASFTAIGASFTGVTVTVTIAEAVRLPS